MYASRTKLSQGHGQIGEGDSRLGLILHEIPVYRCGAKLKSFLFFSRYIIIFYSSSDYSINRTAPYAKNGKDGELIRYSPKVTAINK